MSGAQRTQPRPLCARARVHACVREGGTSRTRTTSIKLTTGAAITSRAVMSRAVTSAVASRKGTHLRACVSACLQRERARARSCARNGAHFTRMCMSKSEWLNRSPVSFDVTCVRVRAELSARAQRPNGPTAGAESLQAIQLRSLAHGRTGGKG